MWVISWLLKVCFFKFSTCTAYVLVWRNRPYTYNSDVWALGCVLFEVGLYKSTAGWKAPGFSPCACNMVSWFLKR
jgi:serine/threonine protein kinase